MRSQTRQTRMPRDTVFISYSHKDEDCLRRVKNLLSFLELRGKVSIWDDTMIRPGARWDAEITAALDSMCAAVLLVSKNFLNSRYIWQKEMPLILKAASLGSLWVFPVLARRAHIHDARLLQWEFVPKYPTSLEHLSAAEQEQVLHKLVFDIAARLPPDEGALLRSVPHVQVPFYVSSAFPAVDYRLSGRHDLLKALDQAWKKRRARVVTLVAPGGIGKTALVNHWLQDLAKQGWCGAKRVFIWSFYSQGSDEGKQVSSEPFLHAAFGFFGLGEPGKESAWDKGRMLAGRILEQRTLLVLDGLETLQEPAVHSQSAGRLRDQAVLSLLLALADGQPGLAVVNTRLPLVDLDRCDPALCPRLDLKRLDRVAGAELLRRLLAPPDAPDWQTEAVARIPEAELRSASEEFGGHPLALRLLAGYLASAHGGEIQHRKEIGPLLGADGEAGHARRMMRQYEELFRGGPELHILHLVGLFDRPAPPGAIAALRAKNIPGLTPRRRGLSGETWAQSLAVLRQTGLLTQESDGSLDCHPLVREYFGGRLQAKHPQAWRTAHSTLFDHFRRFPKSCLPRTWNEMEALVQAVACGCQAGRYREAKKLYELRVVGWDDHGTPRYLSSVALRRFGASNLYLSALYHFFQKPWTEPSGHLNTSDQAFVLHEAGHYLFILGRLKDGLTAMQLGLERRVALNDWREASTAARLIREVYLYLGQFQEAQEYAEQGIKFADRTNSRFQRMGLRAAMAQVLFYRGELDAAARFFDEAERIERARCPECPSLTYIWGFWQCELLLERAKRTLEASTEHQAPPGASGAVAILKEVERRATKSLVVAQKLGSIFDIAHAQQTLGETLWLKHRLGGKGDLGEALAYLDLAVNGLRQTGQQHHLVSGLLARAGLHRGRGDWAKAQTDLEEAQGIATRSAMVIHQIDINLEYARLYRARRQLAKATRCLEEAGIWIRKTGYHRRDRDVAAHPPSPRA